MGATAVVAASLLWPAVGAQALAGPAERASVGTDAAADQEATASLSGRVTDGTGAPLEGVRVQVLGDGPPAVYTAADGTWSVVDVVAGPHVLRFVLTGPDGDTHSLYWNGTRYGTHAFTWLPTLDAGEDRSGLDVTFVDNGATGTVTSAGAPVAGATVGFYRSPSDPSPATTVTTAADGTWTARWLRPDSYAVRVTPPDGSGLAPAWWNYDGTSYGSLFFDGTARTLPPVDVALSAESRLGGRVVDEAGRPVAGLRVALWTGRNRPFLAEYATTAADGTYTFHNLDASSYTVQVAPDFHWSGSDWAVKEFLGGALAVRGAVWTAVGAQQEATVADLVLRAGGTISGSVVAEPGWDGPGISVELLAPDGSVVASVPAQDNADGPDFATSGAIPAGEYRLRAPMPGDGYWWLGGTSFETARVLDLRPGGAIDDVELVLSDAFAGVPPEPDVALTEDNRGGLSVAGPVAAGGTAAIAGLEQPASSYVWLAPAAPGVASRLAAAGAAFQGLGYGQVGADGTLRFTIPAGVVAGAYRVAVTTPGGFLTGWADVTVTAATGPSGSVPAGPSAAAPGAAAAPSPATAAASSASTSARPAQRSGVLATTGFGGAWVAGAALAAVLLGAGLLVLRRRSA
ncbi:MSCRAMM family protein [Cellulomonas chitinilytica]|uniref:MSCRAMM family protein n=1 Tax=Cellulomonas chitinilytica TaxID=398759 RepID=UPI00194088CD|nr:carboxypeptidase-like regulatory domain-containing protein [Cellulomonas chitinilytica]